MYKLMRKFLKVLLCSISIACIAGTAMAQQQYCGDEVGFANNASESSVILTVEKIADTKALLSIEPSIGGNKLDVLLAYVMVDGVQKTIHITSESGETIMSSEIDFADAPSIITITNLLWSYADGTNPGAQYHSGELQALFGTCDGGETVEDTEAPTDFTLLSATPSIASAAFAVQATDNSGLVKYTVTMGDKSATATGNSEVETVVTVSGLNPSTTYDYTITAEDLAGNKCETVLTGSVTTEATEQWCEKMITHFGYTDAGYMSNAVLVSIEKVNETTVELTAVPYTEGRQLDILQANLDGVVQNFNNAENPQSKVTLTFNYSAVPSVLSVNEILWSDNTMGGNEMIQNYIAAAGVCETVTPDPTDTEAPVITTAVVDNITHESATLTVNITDNVAETVTVEVSADDFATVLYTYYAVACGSNVALDIDDLKAETTYNLSVRATDASDNVSEVKTLDTFVTAEAPVYETATFYGYMIDDDDTVDNEDWAEVNTPQDASEPFAPDLYYSIVTNPDNTLTFNLELMQTAVGLVAEVWVNGSLLVSETYNEKMTYTTTVAYERGETLSVNFRFPYAGGVSTTKPFTYTVGASQNLPSALDDVKTTAGIAYVDNVVYATGFIVVYDINGFKVARGYDCVDLRALNGGIYIVRNGENVRKVVR